MIKHIILWKLKEDAPAEAKAEVKARLEALNGKIPGMISLTVHNEGLASSSADMMLDSAFEDEASLAGYQTNPLHVAAASYVRQVVEQRLCLDFEA